MSEEQITNETPAFPVLEVPSDAGVLAGTQPEKPVAMTDGTRIYTTREDVLLHHPSVEIADGQCVVHPGQCVPIFDGMDKCTWEPESCIYFGPIDDIDVPPDIPSQPQLPKGSKMNNPHVPASPESNDIVQTPDQPVAVDTHASVGVADTPDVLKLAQQGPIGGNTLILATIAMLGGGAAWKFYSQYTKQNHEEKMAEIEKNNGNNEENKKRCEGHALTCANSTRDLQAKLDDATKKLSDALSAVDMLKAKVTELENGMGKAIRAGKNVDDLEERIEEMEDKLKKKLKENNNPSA